MADCSWRNSDLVIRLQGLLTRLDRPWPDRVAHHALQSRREAARFIQVVFPLSPPFHDGEFDGDLYHVNLQCVLGLEAAVTTLEQRAQVLERRATALGPRRSRRA